MSLLWYSNSIDEKLSCNQRRSQLRVLRFIYNWQAKIKKICSLMWGVSEHVGTYTCMYVCICATIFIYTVRTRLWPPATATATAKTLATTSTKLPVSRSLVRATADFGDLLRGHPFIKRNEYTKLLCLRVFRWFNLVVLLFFHEVARSVCLSACLRFYWHQRKEVIRNGFFNYFRVFCGFVFIVSAWSLSKVHYSKLSCKPNSKT